MTVSSLFTVKDYPIRVAIFLSGSGSNAENIINHWKKCGVWDKYEIVLFTDRPQKSNAQILAKKYDLDLVENDIHKFYRQRGETKVSIATPEGFKIREEWTNEIRVQLTPRKIDFGIFAGFIPLTNLTAFFPCLNIHPGDLTYLKEGRRYLIGLHTIPIELAILEGINYMRSSVILAGPYYEKEKNMDDGLVLGISEKVNLELFGHTVSDLRRIANARPKKKPAQGYLDELERVAIENQQCLKKTGDWVVFPQVVSEFSNGNYGVSENGGLFYWKKDKWVSITTLVYSNFSKPRPFS